jgi:hypothetical protein
LFLAIKAEHVALLVFHIADITVGRVSTHTHLPQAAHTILDLTPSVVSGVRRANSAQILRAAITL